MAVEDHVEALRQRHHDVDERLDEEMRRPHPDELRIQELKRLKLAIKDDLTGFQD